MRESESGQAVVEYVLMLAAAVSLVAIMQSSFRGTIFNIWRSFAQEITAACPTGCQPPPNVK